LFSTNRFNRLHEAKIDKINLHVDDTKNRKYKIVPRWNIIYILGRIVTLC